MPVSRRQKLLQEIAQAIEAAARSPAAPHSPRWAVHGAEARPVRTPRLAPGEKATLTVCLDPLASGARVEVSCHRPRFGKVHDATFADAPP